MMSQPTSDFSDQELLQAISSKDEAAFRQFYNRHQLAVYNYLLRLIHLDPAAEEILQEVFLAVWQGARKFRGKSSVKTWIFRIAYFKAITWLRKEKRLNMVEEPDNYISSDLSPEEVFIEKLETGKIIAALKNLSANHRSVIELTFVHGFSYNEIAEIMKCPVGTVKSRMNYALKNLNRELADREDR